MSQSNRIQYCLDMFSRPLRVDTDGLRAANEVVVVVGGASGVDVVVRAASVDVVVRASGVDVVDGGARGG